MRKFTLAMVGIAAALGIAGAAIAENATKDECVAKTKDAAKMVADRWKDTTSS
jgi:hypothetical protein